MILDAFSRQQFDVWNRKRKEARLATVFGGAYDSYWQRRKVVA